MSYITQTVDEFFAKPDKMQSDLEKFSQNPDNRSEKISTLLKNFEQAGFATNAKKNSGGKSTPGNFFAGKKFFNAPFDNRYKKIAKPVFETEESGRDSIFHVERFAPGRFAGHGRKRAIQKT